MMVCLLVAAAFPISSSAPSIYICHLSNRQSKVNWDPSTIKDLDRRATQGSMSTKELPKGNEKQSRKEKRTPQSKEGKKKEPRKKMLVREPGIAH